MKGKNNAKPTRLLDEHVSALPPRQVLSLVDPSLTSGLLTYADGAQATPTDLSAAGPVPTSAINSAVQSAQSSSAQQNGAVVQNVDSPSSSGYANTTSNP
jgi:hypothetical protein